MEAVDALRTVLLHAARNRQFRTVMVTSPAVGEGKTSLACQLASSLARSGRRTLLLDLDLRCIRRLTFSLVCRTHPGSARCCVGRRCWTRSFIR